MKKMALSHEHDMRNEELHLTLNSSWANWNSTRPWDEGFSLSTTSESGFGIIWMKGTRRWSCSGIRLDWAGIYVFLHVSVRSHFSCTKKHLKFTLATKAEGILIYLTVRDRWHHLKDFVNVNWSFSDKFKNCAQVSSSNGWKGWKILSDELGVNCIWVNYGIVHILLKISTFD